MTDSVLFSIDKVNDIHTLAKFLRYFDTQRAMKKTKDQLIQCIGCYEGKVDLSFICSEDDYIDHILPLEFTKYQECVLWIENNSLETWSVHPSLDWRERDDQDYLIDYVGVFRPVSKKKALKKNAWTYRPDIDTWFVAK